MAVRLSEKSECVLTPEEFEKICELSKEGKEKELRQFVNKIIVSKNCRIVPRTFCHDPRLRKPAPFVLAAQHGRKSVVEYFLNEFGEMINVNHSATIVSLTTGKKVHCVSALWAASTGGHLDIVRVLVAHGADVNQQTSTQSTPFRGAAFHGDLQMMEFLMHNGAEINTPNIMGQSPLCIAATRGQLNAVKYLIERGANVHQKTIGDYTVMHLSAMKGKIEIIKYLLSIGISPMFTGADPLNEDYIPCPLFLAASGGKSEVVEELINHVDCPPSCQADALLLLAATNCETTCSRTGLTTVSRALWIRGLSLKEKNKMQTKSLPPTESYGNRVEVINLEDFHQLASGISSTYEMYFQCLIIRERCMGRNDQNLIYFLIRRGKWFCNRGEYKMAELLWFRAMDAEVRACEVLMRHSRYGYPNEHVLRDCEEDLSQFACGIWSMVHAEYEPSFKHYIQFGIKQLERCKTTVETECVQVILGIMLYIFASWLHCLGIRGASCSEECRELGQQFVSKYLYAVEGSTLLHYALTAFTTLKNEERIEEKYANMTPLIAAILNWGADEAVGIPNHEGKRPIDIALEQASEYDANPQELISLLVSRGASSGRADQRIAALEENVRKAEHQAKESEKRASMQEVAAKEARQKAERDVCLLQQEMRNITANCEETVRQAEREKQEAVQRASNAEQRASDAEQRLRELAAEKRSQDEKRFWVVTREEIELTTQELGRGGWAVVKVAKFRGLQVAAKCLHNVIISDYNRQLFVREMNIAARVRHPNLIQFMGATMKGEPIILTELMATSLRAVLERRPFNPPQITSISLDVAKALNYLHLMQPDPIIHRDVSSANVLLDPAPNNNWKAKISDYGSANFVRRVATVGPGNPTYAAPEANDPSQQSPKMDVYSYGVLLLEICTQRFPDEEDRDELFKMVKQPGMLELIEQCLQDRPNMRPTMSEVLRR